MKQLGVLLSMRFSDRRMLTLIPVISICRIYPSLPTTIPQCGMEGLPLSVFSPVATAWPIMCFLGKGNLPNRAPLYCTKGQKMLRVTCDKLGCLLALCPVLSIRFEVHVGGYLGTAPARVIWEAYENFSLENILKLNIPADFQQNTCRSSGRYRVLLKALCALCRSDSTCR